MSSNTLKNLKNETRRLGRNIIEKEGEMINLFNSILESQLQFIRFISSVCDFKRSIYKLYGNQAFKNIITMISIMHLYEDGYVGTCEMLFRNIYESLIISKYMAISNDEKLGFRWESGEQINLNKNIFSKLLNTPSKESIEFWDFLNKYTHATIYSQDNILECDKARRSNFYSIMTVLLAMNYHLLNSIALKYYVYYINLYFKDIYKEERNKIKYNLKYAISMIDDRCKKVIKEYKASWKIK